MEKLVQHRVSKTYPKMTHLQFRQLVEDIKQNGLKEPILLYEGRVADGWHRYRACRELARKKVKVKGYRTKDWKGDLAELLAYLKSRNLHRRHLTKSQRTMIAAEEVEPQLAAEAKQRQREGGKRKKVGAKMPQADKPKQKRSPRASDQAGEAMGVSGRAVRDGKRIAKEAPELTPLLNEGTLTVAQAKGLLKLDDAERREVLKRVDQVGAKQALKEQRSKTDGTAAGKRARLHELLRSCDQLLGEAVAANRELGGPTHLKADEELWDVMKNVKAKVKTLLGLPKKTSTTRNDSTKKEAAG